MNEDYYGPIWIDSRFYEMHRPRRPRRLGDYYETVTTTGANTTPLAPALDEEQVRRIVREEMADLVKPDIPDAPPADL